MRRLNGGRGVDYVIECSGAPDAVNEAARMVNRGGKICLAAFPHEPAQVDIAYLVRNNIYVFGIRGEGKSATHRAEAFMAQKRFDATKVHTHPSRWKIFRPRCVTPVSASRTPSRSSSKPMATRPSTASPPNSLTTPC